MNVTLNFKLLGCKFQYYRSFMVNKRFYFREDNIDATRVVARKFYGEKIRKASQTKIVVLCLELGAIRVQPISYCFLRYRLEDFDSSNNFTA